MGPRRLSFREIMGSSAGPSRNIISRSSKVPWNNTKLNSIFEIAGPIPERTRVESSKLQLRRIKSGNFFQTKSYSTEEMRPNIVTEVRALSICSFYLPHLPDFPDLMPRTSETQLCLVSRDWSDVSRTAICMLRFWGCCNISASVVLFLFWSLFEVRGYGKVQALFCSIQVGLISGGTVCSKVMLLIWTWEYWLMLLIEFERIVVWERKPVGIGLSYMVTFFRQCGVIM